MQSPISIFKSIWVDAKKVGEPKHRNAVCLSTISAAGYPSSRFVDLKEVDEPGFVFCTHLDSKKAEDIGRDAKTGLTIWWEHVGMQIRVTGVCAAISDHDADAHWSTRTRDAQLATATFQQSRPLSSLDVLALEYSHAANEYEGKDIPRPSNWGGFRLSPNYMEFLEFKETRLHVRTVYELVEARWSKRFLQP